MPDAQAEPATLPPVKFTILDGMLLVATAGAGLALSRYWLSVIPGGLDVRMTPGLFTWSVFISWTTTLALIPLRYLRPARSGRRGGELPGTAACLAVLVGIIYVIANRTPYLYRAGFLSRSFAFSYMNELLQYNLYGLTVLASWGTLVVSGRWQGERDWIDRLGRALGAFWIASPLLGEWNRV